MSGMRLVTTRRLNGLDGTRELAKLLAKSLFAGARVGLSGTLGAGKTELVRKLVGVLGGEESFVSSPTYVLEGVYRFDDARATNPNIRVVRHWDFYRLADGASVPEALDDRGFEQTATLVEWPDRSPDWAVEEDMRIELSAAPNEPEDVRTARVLARDGQVYAALAAAFAASEER